jgi:hypothetical protein
MRSARKAGFSLSRPRPFRAFAVGTFLMLFLPACGGPPTAAEPPMLTGRIAAIEPTDRHNVRVHVGNVTSPSESPGDLYLHVSAESVIFMRKPDGSTARGSLKDLSVGLPISAWHTGVELRSSPPQYTATRVDVTHTLERPAGH